MTSPEICPSDLWSTILLWMISPHHNMTQKTKMLLDDVDHSLDRVILLQ